MHYKLSAFIFYAMIFLLNLADTGAFAEAKNTVKFSSEDITYVREKQVLRVSVLPDWQPFVYYSKKHGQYRGLAIEALERMSLKTGLRLAFVPADNYAQSLNQLRSGECDVSAVLLCDDGKEYTAQLKLIFYLRSVKSIIFNRGTDPYNLTFFTIAAVEGTESLLHPEIKTVSYKTITDCMTAVRSGRADLFSCNLYTSDLLLAQLNARELIAVPTSSAVNIGFGLPANPDEQLVSILRKAVQLRSAYAVTGEILQYKKHYQKRPLDYLYEYPFEVSSFIISLCFVIVIIGMTYSSIRLRRTQAINGYEESYRLLTDAFGEAGLEYDCLHDKLTLFGKKKEQFNLAAETDGFFGKLEEKSLQISLTSKQFVQMLKDGISGNGFQSDFQLGLKNGDWMWCRLLYTVICTEESHRIPLRLIGCIVNIEQEQAEKEYLLELGLYDQLTGLLNRNAARRKINMLFSTDSHAPRGSKGILLILDIDNFKNLNDNFGHLCGDDVLRFLGTVLKESFDSRDILCRWGGDEFLLFLVGMADYPNLAKERIGLLYKKMASYTYNGMPCPVTLSIGGFIAGERSESLEELFKKADDALYAVKKQGRNNFLILDEQSAGVQS